MKKNILFLFGLIVLLSSCKEDKLDTFSGESDIYFTLQRWKGGMGIDYKLEFPFGDIVYTQEWEMIRQTQDSITKSYALDYSGDLYDTIYIPVSLMGDVTDYDRTFSYKFKESTQAVEGTDFRIVTAMIPAHKSIGAIAVEVDRESLKDTTYIIDFRLVPNNNFQTNYTTINRSSTNNTKVDLREFRLRISDLLEKPQRWNNSYLGPFSRKKVRLLIEVANADIDYLYSAKPDTGILTSWGKLLKLYLLDQMNNHNNIIYDEDGSIMTSGTNV
ncbi:MAG: DUF4843 domain-containing protein [Dysgonomonas sp.]|nr:DUF4843 domain-containing protein [Dysgonomonas sp.]